MNPRLSTNFFLHVSHPCMTQSCSPMMNIYIQAYYITTARELARMVGIRKAPILHHFSESIAGAATIRCFNLEQMFMTKVKELIDDYSRVAFHNYATMEWLSVRINFLFNLVFYFVLIILVTLPRSAIDPSKFILPPSILSAMIAVTSMRCHASHIL